MRPLETYKKPRFDGLSAAKNVWAKIARGELFFDPWKLLRWRLMRELSIGELGRKAWKDKRRPDVYVWRYEAGQVNPRRDSIERLAKVLNVTPLDLLSDKKTLDENAAYLLERNTAAKL